MDDIWNKPVNDLRFTAPMLRVLERQKITTCGELFANFAAHMGAASAMAAGAEPFIQTDRVSNCAGAHRMSRRLEDRFGRRSAARWTDEASADDQICRGS
jgi:hypothetical protein